jgi:RNA polymerase sigma-54 factor
VLYQREDAFVEATEKGLKLTVYDNWGGKFTLNQEYVQLSKTTTNNQVKDYLKEQLGKARQLQQLLAERHHTLVLVFHALVTHQEPFFREGPGPRQPLKLADLAEETGMSISTISRALSHKYIACKWGSFPADSFLVNAGTTETQQVITDEKFEHLIRSIIDAEDKKHPLSDQGICQKLEEQGIKAARRTVNKYRTKMGIGDKSARKKWE